MKKIKYRGYMIIKIKNVKTLYQIYDTSGFYKGFAYSVRQCKNIIRNILS